MSEETDDPIETTDPDAPPVNPENVDEDAATILDEANAGNGSGNTDKIDDDEIDDDDGDDGDGGGNTDKIDDEEIDGDDGDGGGNTDDTDPDEDGKRNRVLPVLLLALSLLGGLWAISMLIPSNPGPVIAAADDDDSAEDDSFYVDVDPDHCVFESFAPHARHNRLV
ncbi:MAG TPA: hypothetical protein QF873_04190, partial [Patescibacteria group bacterium]|nr:hypothetical protein [Patescibacteria group bacterium]